MDKEITHEGFSFCRPGLWVGLHDLPVLDSAINRSL